MTAQQLSERLGEVGLEWDRAVIANFESGRRRFVTVEELLALAYVLNVAPLHLMVPPDSDPSLDRYAVTPGEPPKGYRLAPDQARAWIRGEAVAGAQDPRIYFSEVPIYDWHAGQNMPFHPGKDNDGEH